LPAGAPFLPLTGGAVSGPISATGSRTWSDAVFPGVQAPQIYQSLTYSGSPTAGVAGVEGTSYPINAILLHESLNTPTGGPGGAAALEIQHYTTGGSGARYALLASHQLSGTIAAGGNAYWAATFLQTTSANVVGATTGSGNGRGQFGSLGLYTYLGVPGVGDVFCNEAAGIEWDFKATAGSTADYVCGIKLVNFSPTGWHAYGSEAFMIMATNNPATMGTFSRGIQFGDPQAGDGKGFPISPTGTMISALAGSAGIGIDFSAVTFGTAFLKGPGFQVDTSGVHIGGGAQNVLTITPGGSTAGGITFAESGNGGYLFGSGSQAVLQLIPGATTGDAVLMIPTGTGGINMGGGTTLQVGSIIGYAAAQFAGQVMTTGVNQVIAGSGTGNEIRLSPAAAGSNAMISAGWGTDAAPICLFQTTGGAGPGGFQFNSRVGFNGTAPVAKPTGYSAPTGTATRATFLTSSVTLPVLAEHVKALIDDLTSYGLIGP
jgi:hypothetical protein